MAKILERCAHVAWESLTMTFSKKKSVSHEHAKCARRRGESAVLMKWRLRHRKCAFRRGESVVFENVHAVEARAPFWPFENMQKTEEDFEVLLQNERFASTKRAFVKEDI